MGTGNWEVGVCSGKWGWVLGSGNWEVGSGYWVWGTEGAAVGKARSDGRQGKIKGDNIERIIVFRTISWFLTAFIKFTSLHPS